MPAGRVCAVCARVLDSHPLLGWVHTYADRIPEDHPPVPVDWEQVHVRGRCDFCSAEAPAWVVPAESFQVAPGHGSEGDWASCDRCVTFVRRDDWAALARHAAHQLNSAGAGVDPSILEGMYLVLRDHLTGQPRPLR